jgi:hypothetical protein
LKGADRVEHELVWADPDDWACNVISKDGSRHMGLGYVRTMLFMALQSDEMKLLQYSMIQIKPVGDLTKERSWVSVEGV